MEEKRPEDKRYLKWYHKLAYGSGDLACNLGYGLIGSFIMIYLTNTVGLNSAVIGMLMMASKFLDGVTDIFFGSMMDRTHTRLGKARPWMLYAQVGVSLCTFLLFCVPASSAVMQYVYFFIVYTSLNAVFFTANGIAYSALSALITRSANERVQLGSIRFMFSLFTNILVPSITMGLVEGFGGGAAGWRTVALVYAVLALLINSISCLSVRELPEERKTGSTETVPTEKISLAQSARYLLSNKYYLVILGIYLCQYCGSDISQGVGVYYMTYIMGNPALLGLFSMAQMLPMIVALSVTPHSGEKVRQYVEGQLLRILSVAGVRSWVYRRGAGEKRHPDAGLHDAQGCLHRFHHGYPQRLCGGDQRLHLQDPGRTSGRYHVQLLLSGRQGGRRHRQRPVRPAAGGGRL